MDNLFEVIDCRTDGSTTLTLEEVCAEYSKENLSVLNNAAIEYIYLYENGNRVAIIKRKR